MTKQEEIKKGVESILKTMLKAVSNTGSASPRTYTEILRNYLHSQGVVIKVERKLPRFGIGENLVAVKPLIEEGK